VRPLIVAPLILVFALGASLSSAAPLWTFCVALELGTKDVWITTLFSPTSGRESLEAELKRLLERQGHPNINAQCPRPSEDRVSVVNAQTTADEFNRKLGSTIHEVSSREFPPR